MIKIIIYIFLFIYNLFGNEHHYPDVWNELQNNEGWRLIKETSRVKIFSKDISVSPFPCYRAEIISSLSMSNILTVAWDVEKSTEVFPNAYIVDAGIYHKRGSDSYSAYQLFDIPFMSPRLYQFNSIMLHNKIHWIRTDTLSQIYNPHNLLTPPVNFGSWQVEKYGEKTKLTYSICTNPGGSVPSWIVELANQRYLPQMLLDLEIYAIINSK